MQILEAWKPTEDLKFRLEFFSHAVLHIALKIMAGHWSLTIAKASVTAKKPY